MRIIIKAFRIVRTVVASDRQAYRTVRSHHHHHHHHYNHHHQQLYHVMLIQSSTRDSKLTFPSSDWSYSQGF